MTERAQDGRAWAVFIFETVMQLKKPFGALLFAGFASLGFRRVRPNSRSPWRSRHAVRKRHAVGQRSRGAQGEGLQGSAALAHFVGFRECGVGRRQGRVRQGRHRCGPTTDAEFDAAKQRSDIETALAARPNVILTLPLDPVSSAEAFKDAVKGGVKFWSSSPTCWPAISMALTMRQSSPTISSKWASWQPTNSPNAIGRKGKVGYLFHDANYYVTNQRDQAFKTTIEKHYPDIKIVTEQGISDPARAEELANAMLVKNPDLDGIYVTWAEPADGVLTALRASGNTHTKVVTLDLSEPVALDMVKGGNVVGLVADKAYELGRAMAAAGMKSLLGQETPEFIVAPALTVTKENVAQGWRDLLNRDAPQSVLDAARSAIIPMRRLMSCKPRNYVAMVSVDLFPICRKTRDPVTPQAHPARLRRRRAIGRSDRPLVFDR